MKQQMKLGTSKLAKALKSSTTLTLLVGVLIGGLVVGGGVLVRAETYPGGTDNGKTSRIKQLNDDLVTLGYGSPSNTPDWGANWNRISTSAKWLPSGNITPSDVVNGKKFYNASRIEQTGTKLVVSSCPTQAWHDADSKANKTDNCVPDWPVASPAQSGDDKQDPVTRLVWSKCLKNTAGTNDFSPDTGCSTYSWDGSHANNSDLTAIELCSDRGSGWRLPVQKELMQAYIDGSFYNLIAPSAFHWSATEASVANAWYTVLSNGYTNDTTKAVAIQVRCVR